MEEGKERRGKRAWANLEGTRNLLSLFSPFHSNQFEKSNRDKDPSTPFRLPIIFVY